MHMKNINIVNDEIIIQQVVRKNKKEEMLNNTHASCRKIVMLATPLFLDLTAETSQTYQNAYMQSVYVQYFDENESTDRH